MAVVATLADELNTYLPDVGNELEDTIRHPSDFIDWMMASGTKRPFNGDLREEVFDTKKSVLTQGIYAGNERLGFRNPQRTQQISWRGHRTVSTLALFNRDIAIAKGGGKNKILDLYADLPQKGALDPVLNLERFILTGQVLDADVVTAADYAGWMTLYGPNTGGKVSGLANGMLQMVAPASQNTNTLNLAKSLALGWYNQYANIASMASEGKRVLSKIISDCIYNDPSRTDPEVLWVDRDSFVEYGELRKNKLIIVDNTRKDDQASNEDWHPIDGCKTKMRYTRQMDAAVDFNGTAGQYGLGYLLHGEDIEISVLEDLKVGKWEPLVGTDMTVMTMPWHMRLALLRHRRNGIVTGFLNA